MTGKTKTKIEFFFEYFIIYHEKHIIVVCFFVVSGVGFSDKQA
jgi:hypothetical protein